MGQHKSTHKRCNTCKIRKVKCDETRPACLQCLKQAYVCTYKSGEFGFRATVENVIDLNGTEASSRSNGDYHHTGHILSGVSILQSARFSTQSCRPIIRFALRTGPSMFSQSPEASYPKTLLRLAQGRPYLKHAVLTITITHDWTLYGSDCARAATIQAYHMSACARTLHDRLCQPPDHSEADFDALWASAALLMCASVAGPVRVKHKLDDIDWIHVCRRTANFALRCDALREHRSLMCWLNPQKNWSIVGLTGPATVAEQALDCAIEDAMRDTLDDEDGVLGRNLVPSLRILMRMHCNTETVFDFLAWFTTWPDSLLTKVKNRNVNAMLILALWCTKTSDFRWWLSARALSILRETSNYFDHAVIPTSSCKILLDHCRAACNKQTTQLENIRYL